MADTVRFDARIETITFYNADNNYHIMKFSTTSQLEGLKYEYGRYQGTLVGYCVTCVEGDYVQVEGEYMVHPQFGPQYKIVSLGFDKPENADQLYTFLSAILTPNQAKMLYTYYPDIVDSVINDNNYTPDLRPLKGIGESSWKRIRDKIIADFCYKDLITLLAPCDVTLLMIHNIAEHFKIKDMNLLREKIIQNPYILYQVSRLGFKKVDAYALKLDPNLENSLQRARACIEYILTNFAEMDGHSYIPISLLKDEFKKTISGKEILEKMQDVLDEQREKYINGTPDFLYLDDENVGLIMYYRMENYIRDKLLEISQTNNFWNISYKDFFERMESTAKKQGFYLSDEQSEVVRSITENNITVLSGKAGCVDCDTEYFNGIEWKRIADYKEGDKVLSYNIETKEAVLDYPELYHKYPCEQLWHFETKYGLDQCLCDEHNVVYMTSKGNINKKKFSEFKEQHEKSVIGFQGRFLTSFNYSGKGIDLTNDEIRIMVAVIADGSFYYQAEDDWDSYYRCRFHIKKNRKKERLRKLFIDAGYKWTEKESSAEGYTDFYIDAPRREKVFSKDYWYNCNQEQLKIIADELSYWDGAIKDAKLTTSKQFFTNVKETADFVQFVYSSCGYRATIQTYDRIGKNHMTDNKNYEYKTIEYTVNATSRNLIGMTRKCFEGREKVKIKPYKTIDGYKYCFTMPLGTLVLRRNNKIFITGNCGKTSVIKAVLEVYKDKRISMAALSAKAAKRMREVTEKYASTIHMLLGYENGGFVHNEDNLLPCDLLIIDECSMNNIHLFHSLLKATSKYTKILFCGDFAQVPSIGVGAVFTDLINTNVFNNHNLTKVYRQSEDSYIVEHANIVREGIMPFDITTGNMPFGNDTVYFFRTQSEDIQDLSVGIFIKFLEQGIPLNDLAIVVPRKETVAVSCEKINNLIQDALFDENVLEISNNNKTKTFKLGCRVINKKNDYKKGVLNGDTGIVTSIDVKKGEFYVTLEDDRTIQFSKGDMANVELGYAITVHSAQGSQYKNCIVALDMSSYTLLSANMIYTAMTRAVNKLIVISQPSAFCKAVTNMKENNRYTWLKNILTEEDKFNLLLNKKEQVKNNIVTIEEDKILLPERNEVYNSVDEDPFWDEPLPF